MKSRSILSASCWREIPSARSADDPRIRDVVESGAPAGELTRPDGLTLHVTAGKGAFTATLTDATGMLVASRTVMDDAYPSDYQRILNRYVTVDDLDTVHAAADLPRLAMMERERAQRRATRKTPSAHAIHRMQRIIREHETTTD